MSSRRTQHVKAGSKHLPSRAGDESDSDTSSGPDEEGDSESENQQELGNGQSLQLVDDRKQFEECWKQIMKDLNDEELEKSENAQETFFAKHKASLRPRPDLSAKGIITQERNMLCRLTVDGKPKLPHLVKLLVEEYPQLLEDTMFRQRVFDIALDAKRDWFLQAVLESKIKHEDLGRALAPVEENNEQGHGKSNCVHKAINMNLDPSLTKLLIEKAPSDLLTAQDDKGLTPLHHAVHYQRCVKGRVRVVKHLLRYGDGALDKRTLPPQSYSPYRYHMYTRPKKPLKPAADEAEGKIDQETRGEQGRGVQRSGEYNKAMPGSDKGPHETEQKKSKDEEKEKEKDKKKEREKEKEKGKDTPTQSGGGLQRAPTFNSGPATEPRANEGRLVSGSGPLPTPPNGSVTTAPTKLITAANKLHTSKNSQKASTKKANEVAMSLKLSYFRSIFKPQSGDQCAAQRNHASVEQYLYGDNKDNRAISFQFPPVHRKELQKIDFERFKESYQRFTFDPMLLNVDFGKFRREWPDDERSVKKRLELGPGRRDLVDFFTWLYDDKEVRNIIRVSVDDDDDVPHSDDAIIASLKRFDVEILDWRKADLCPLAIRQSCASSLNLRELHLYWAGNNAILRSWSANGGLAFLPNLEQVHIYEVKPSLDSPDRTDANIRDFKKHLNGAPQDKKEQEDEKVGLEDEQRIKVNIHRYHEFYGYEYGIQKPLSQGTHRPQIGKRINEHQWLEIMDRFVGAVRKVQEEKLRNFPDKWLTCPTLPSELSKDITVALIDDGVDFMHPAISKNLTPGRSFDSGFGSHDRLSSPAPFHGSTTGHGTFMAYMIQRVCPSVKIIPYKIDVQPKDKDGDAVTFTAKSAADAVEDAVQRGFDIISMSWSVQRNDSKTDGLNNKKDLDRLKESLIKASDRRDRQGKKIGQETLLFCSAPDIGESRAIDTHYPFNCEGISKRFKIGAAQATGKAYPWSGDQVDYILPGEDVGMKPSDTVWPSVDKVLRTGSSVATALAAGLAALIIHCVRLGAVYNFHRNQGDGLSEDSVRAIKTFKAMKAAFEIISKSDSTKGERRLEVETVFKRIGEDLILDAPESEEKMEQWKEGRWKTITDIARYLLDNNIEKEFVKTFP